MAMEAANLNHTDLPAIKIALVFKAGKTNRGVKVFHGAV
jgi:hypothetical protein